MNTFFRHFAQKTSDITGSAWAFMVALGMIVVWLVSGPLFHFSDTWQLVINTSTTIITFLMVFLIQNAQNRESRALHLKLDELIRAVEAARNKMVDLEEASDEEIAELEEEFREVKMQELEKQGERA